MDLRQNNGSIKAVSPRHCAAIAVSIALNAQVQTWTYILVCASSDMDLYIAGVLHFYMFCSRFGSKYEKCVQVLSTELYVFERGVYRRMSMLQCVRK